GLRREREARRVSRVGFWEGAREPLTDSRSFEELFNLGAPARIVCRRHVSLNGSLVQIHFIKREPSRSRDRSNQIKPDVPRFLARLRGVEGREFEEIVESLRLHFKTNHDHHHGEENNAPARRAARPQGVWRCY